MAAKIDLQINVVVIGAGVVGLATARVFAQLGRQVLIFENEAAIGLHTYI